MNFIYYNPVKIIFGIGSLRELNKFINSSSHILFVYGKESIKNNGTYNSILRLLKNNFIIEYPGVTSNPTYKNCKIAANFVKNNNIDFILAVGGGSVIDFAKYTAALSCVDANENNWELFKNHNNVKRAIPIGVVLTNPGTGTEMNFNAVISNDATGEKHTFRSYHYYPKFSILDPELMMSLPKQQICNGIIDSFSHVIEQYLTYPVNAWVQDKFSEGLLSILYNIGTNYIDNIYNYDIMSNYMWTSTNALNGIIGCGVPQDWSSHIIAHAITSSFNIDHAGTIAIVLPGVIKFLKEEKKDKIIQMIHNVFHLCSCTNNDYAINIIEKFFNSLGKQTYLKSYQLDESSIDKILNHVVLPKEYIGEKTNINIDVIKQILTSRL